MSSSGTSFSFKDLLGVIGSAIGGGLVTGFAGLIVGIALDIFRIQINSSSSFFLFSNGLWVGAAIGAIIAIVSQTSERANASKTKREQEQRQRLATAQQHQQRLTTLETEIRTACSRAVEAFEQLPTDLSNARGWSTEARQHFRSSAYSPFWHAIENSYDCLGYFNERIVLIGNLTRQYTTSMDSYRDEGGIEVFPEFPVQLDAAAATQAAEATARELNAVVYEAQRDAVFAQIWEQRRTTAAVIRGFANLEVAVNRMSSTLAASIGSLGSSVGSLSSSVGSMRANIASASATSASLNAAQLRAQEELNTRMGKAVYYLKEEHRRASGLL